jgi:hypothetical protein
LPHLLLSLSGVPYLRIKIYESCYQVNIKFDSFKKNLSDKIAFNWLELVCWLCCCYRRTKMSPVERIGVSVDKKLSLPSQRRGWLPFAVLTDRGVLSLTIDWRLANLIFYGNCC